MPNELYPIFIKVDKINVLIVGGGKVALEKLQFLLKSSPNANVTLVAKEIAQEIKQLKNLHKCLNLQERAFFDEDLTLMNMVLIATENSELNQKIRAESNSRGILTNVADSPANCDFYLGGIVTKGDLKIAISTNGKSPTIAKRIREVLEEAIPEEIDVLLQNLRSIRDNLKGDFESKVKKLNQLTASLVAKEKE